MDLPDFYVDYQKLNGVKNPLPRIDETLEALGGSLALDGSPHWTCYQGCWQVEMNQVD